MNKIKPALLLNRSPRYPAPIVVPHEVTWLAVNNDPNCAPVRFNPIFASGNSKALMPELNMCFTACPTTTTAARTLRSEFIGTLFSSSFSASLIPPITI